MAEILVEFAGHPHPRSEVLRWEDRRIDRAARKIGVPAPAPGDVGVRREAFLRTKLDLGPGEIRRRLRRDIAVSTRVGTLQARLSSRRRTSVVDIYADGVRAAEFVDWFGTASKTPDLVVMIGAHPDHFDLGYGPRGQEVLETTGGSPVAVFFYVDYDDTSALTTAADPAFPHQLAGVARTASGTAIGGVRHQFRDTDRGLHGRLTVEFPLTTLRHLTTQHCWHLACEFSNWIESCISEAALGRAARDSEGDEETT